MKTRTLIGIGIVVIALLFITQSDDSTPTSISSITENIPSIQFTTKTVTEPKAIEEYEDIHLNTPIKLNFAFANNNIPNKVQVVVVDDYNNVLGRYIAVYEDSNVIIRKGTDNNIQKITLTLSQVQMMSGFAEDGEVSYLDALRISLMNIGG